MGAIKFYLLTGGIMIKIKHVLAFVILTTTSAVHAATKIPLQNLDKSDYEGVVSDFSANFTHTSVSGASSLGKLFGFEIGVLGGVAKTSTINRLAKEVDPSITVDKLPHAALLGIVSIPFGLTAEANVIPKVGGDEFKYSHMSTGIKWTLTDSILTLPFSLALKGHVAKSAVDFRQTISSVDTRFKYASTVSGATLMLSKDLLIFEPYIGVGLVQSEGKMDVTGSSSVFSDPNLQSAQSATAKKSGSLFVVGTEVKLLVFKAGIEYTKLFDTTRMTAKATIYF